MNKYTQNYTIAQRESPLWLEILGGICFIALMIIGILIVGSMTAQ